MEETLSSQERKVLVESIKDDAIERHVLHHYGLSAKEAERYAALAARRDTPFTWTT